MKYEIFYYKEDNAYSLIEETSSKKSYDFLTENGLKIHEFKEDDFDETKKKYDKFIKKHYAEIIEKEKKQIKRTNK